MDFPDMEQALAYFIYYFFVAVSWAVGFGTIYIVFYLFGSTIQHVGGVIGVTIVGLIAIVPGFLTFEVLTGKFSNWLP